MQGDPPGGGTSGFFIRLTPAEAAAELAAQGLVERARDEERLRLTALAQRAARDLLRSGWGRTVRWRGVVRRFRSAPEPAETLAERIAASGLFAPGWYRRQQTRRIGNPLAHFVARGLAEGLAPNPFFDPAWYLSHHGHMISPAQSAIEHYIGHGARQLLAPGPLFDPIPYSRQQPGLVLAPDMLAHYMNQGIFRGLAVAPVRVAYSVDT